MVSVSVVIPCYNSSVTIGRCLDSVVTQTMQPLEIILVIDKSDDLSQTLDSINKYRNTHKHINFKTIVPEFKVGVALARNIGWNISSGKYVAFLDSDDTWSRNKISSQFNFMELNVHIDMVCALTSLYCEKKNDCDRNWLVTPLNKYSMLFKNQVSTRTVFLKKSIPLRFEIGKQHSEDYLLWLKIGFENYNVFKFNEVLAYSYKSDYCDFGLASNLEMAERGEIDTLCKIFKQYKICIFLLPIALLFSLLKYLKRKIHKFYLFQGGME